MDIESLAIFVEVAKLSSFNKAAKSLQLPTTNVSATIQRLEQSLGTRLFDRTTRTVALTPVGTQVLSEALQLLAKAEDIRNLTASHAQEPQGLLRITAPPILSSRYLGDWLIEFQQLYPKVAIELIESNFYLDPHKHRVDFSFRVAHAPDPNLESIEFAKFRLGVFATPEFLNIAPPINHPDDLKKIPCIGLTINGQLSPWNFQDRHKKIQLRPDTIMRVENVELVHKAILAGIGVGYISFVDAVAADIERGKLVPVLQNYWAEPSSIYLVHAGQQHMTAKNRRFIDFIVGKIKTIDGELAPR